jgi:hypothetical protein
MGQCTHFNRRITWNTKMYSLGKVHISSVLQLVVYVTNVLYRVLTCHSSTCKSARNIEIKRGEMFSNWKWQHVKKPTKCGWISYYISSMYVRLCKWKGLPRMFSASKKHYLSSTYFTACSLSQQKKVSVFRRKLRKHCNILSPDGLLNIHMTPHWHATVRVTVLQRKIGGLLSANKSDMPLNNSHRLREGCGCQASTSTPPVFLIKLNKWRKYTKY